MGLLMILATLAILSSLVGATTEAATATTNPCNIFLAPSTIPGAGMGMFAGHSGFAIGDEVTDSDLVIPLFEMDWHNGFENYFFLWDEYTWSATMFAGMEQETEDVEAMHACSGGMGAAVNCRNNMINAEDDDSSFTMGTSGVSSSSPGAGAFTPYYGRKFVATAGVPPGRELYVSYGDKYFTSRTAYDTVPLMRDYATANKVLSKFEGLRRGLEKSLSSSAGFKTKQARENLVSAIWSFVVDDWPYKSRPFYALPSNHTEIPEMISKGGAARQNDDESTVDLKWLEEHGQCMDNIKDGVSTIPDAGRGAFARRSIPAGGLVAPAPLIHVGNRSRLVMYDSLPEDEDQKLSRNTSRPIHHQLLLNYCFGHGESSLLLCPYGLLTALINHAPTGKGANTKIDWTGSMRHEEWLKEPHKEWYDTKHTGLSFDFVALRDIEEGEEILLDYGEEWEIAWQKHVLEFDGPRRGYTPAFEMNKDVDLRIKTIDEVDYEHIEGIFTFCRRHLVDLAMGYENAIDLEFDVVDESEEGCYPCRVIGRDDETNRYTAEVFELLTVEKSVHPWDAERDRVRAVLFDVPRDGFYFQDAPYRRDHHQTWSFRHDMRVPDEIFPDAWRDLKEAIPEKENPSS